MTDTQSRPTVTADKIRRDLEDMLIGLNDVVGVSVKHSDVCVFLAEDSQDVRRAVQDIVVAQAPRARLHYEITGEFRAL